MGADRAAKQPFLEHVQEIRRRLFWSLVSLFGGGLLGYWLLEPLTNFLVAPIGRPLVYSSPAGGFDFVFKICLLFGLVVSIPVFIYHILKFIEPVLPRRSSRLVIIALLASCGLAFLGLGFAYFVSLPAALKFLTSFGPVQTEALISTTEYLNFVMVYLAGFAILFQLPLLLLLINRATPLTPGGLRKYQKFIIIGSFVVAAVLTPTPDPLNQVVMALPIILLYELSIGLIRLVNRRRRPPVTGASPASRIRPLVASPEQPRNPSLAPARPTSNLLDLRQNVGSSARPQPASRLGNVLDLRRIAT